MTNVNRILHTVLFTPGIRGRWGLPFLFEGPPGDAKSSKIEAYCKTVGLDCKTLIGSVREPADFNGLPIPQIGKDGKVTSVAMAAQQWAMELVLEGRGAIFLDELTTSAPAVQAAQLRLVLDGAVGDLILPKGVRMIAACNPVSQAANGHDLTLPLANRFGHGEWPSITIDEWSEWATSGGNADEVATVNAQTEEDRVEKVWAEQYAPIIGAITGFLRHRPELLHKMPKVRDPKASKAWPSPRTWEMASRAAAGANVHGLTESERDYLVGGYVSHGVWGEFLTWREHADLPNPADVLDGKVAFKHDAMRLDRTYAVLSGCTALVTPEKSPKRTERSETLWKVLGKVAEDDAVQDLTIPSARALVRARLSASAPARAVLTKINPLLMAANVRPGESA